MARSESPRPPRREGDDHRTKTKKHDRRKEERRSEKGRDKREEERRRKKTRRNDDDEDVASRKLRKDSNDDHSSDEERRDRHRKRRRKQRNESGRKRKSSKSPKKSSRKKARPKYESSSSSSSSEDSDDSSSSETSSSRDQKVVSANKVPSKKLLAKLSARGETLEERRERRNQKRAAKIASRFGYTAESNPFNDPNLHETFNWTKNQQRQQGKKDKSDDKSSSNRHSNDTLEEIETIRRRRLERQQEQDEMERLKADEARMKELEHYDEWAKKEEQFHLQQQRQRSAIRLVEGREKPVDVLAKNLLLFGLSDAERTNQAAVKYKERYNALDELQNLEAELDEPFKLLEMLKLDELRELLVDVERFLALEKETFSDNPNNSIVRYWQALRLVVCDEIKLLEHRDDTAFSRRMEEIKKIFHGQSQPSLEKMKFEVQDRLMGLAQGGAAQRPDGDPDYWRTVLDQLIVHLAKMELSDLHSKMLVRQLEKLEQKKEELTKVQAELPDTQNENEHNRTHDQQDYESTKIPQNVAPDFGNLEEELGLTDEVDLSTLSAGAAWHDKYRPRKPRYFNRVKTGYDWNKYNQTHYDHDNPPPKTVQGYKFNIFYPELVDPTRTPQFFLEPADTDDFCILRFHAGPPYEDVAFKIINREWNRSRKRGFRCTFERGVLSLYFNFSSHWYRR